jgi:hypothetical protein
MTTRIRFIAGYAAVAATLPYLALKLAWLSGATIGFRDPAIAHDSGLYALNLATAGMDAVAILVALTFTHRWGMRVPAWLLLLPIWVGTGLLAPIAVVGPFAALYTMASGSSAVGPASPVQPWVYAVVYTGFVCEGLALLTAFVLYARARWSRLFGARIGDPRPGPAQQVPRAIGTGAAVLAAVTGGAHLAWALGASLGLPARVLATRNAVSDMVDGSHGLLALAGGAGLLMIVWRIGRGVRFWIPLTLTWAGAGSMFAWGLWATVNVLGGTVLSGGGPGLAVLNLVNFGKVLGGLLIGTVAAFTLAEWDTSVAGGSAEPDRELARA